MRFRTAATRGTCSLACAMVIALVLMAATPVLGVGPSMAHADTSLGTVIGANPAWDEINGKPMANLPRATVSQTTNLVDQTVQVSWSNFSPSTDNPFDPTTPRAGIYYGGQGADLYPVWVLQCRGTNPPNDILSSHPSCYLTAAGRTDGPSGLGNSVYAVTNPDGTAAVSFHVETAQTNSLLGCDAGHDCSIVVLPAFGGRQDANSPIDCSDHSLDYPTEANGFQNDPTTLASDNMFGAACSWANRLVIPLRFAPTPNNCPNKAPAFVAAGSPMLARALQQWRAGWCRGSSPLTFDYNSTSNEYQARSSFLGGGSALTSTTDVAFTTQPVAPGSGGRKHTYAPVANSDVAVAFVIDDPKTGRVIPDITLNARLLAKLLTQSYSLQFACTDGGSTSKQSNSCDPAVKGNPDSVFTDPEFLALNPQVTPEDYSAQNLRLGEFLPTVVSGNSDLIWTVTAWIASDAKARGFLSGHRDPWGMHINSYYRGIRYPVSQLQELDPGYDDPAAPPGNGTMQNSWQPVSGLDTVGRLLVGNSASTLSNVQTQCSAPPCSFPKIIDQLGARALFAILDQGQAAAYDFPSAHLVNAAGKAVAPNVASVTAALSSMTTNPDGITQRANFAAKNPHAYPLTMVDYAILPTCGIAASTAAAITSFLSKVAQSQTYGVQPGTIAPGYLALSAAQWASLISAVNAVHARPCPSPPTTSGGGISPVPSPHSAAAAVGNTTSTPVKSPLPKGPPARKTVTTAPAASIVQPVLTPAAFGYRAREGRSIRDVLPLLLAVVAVVLIGGPGIYLAVVSGTATAVATRTRRLLRTLRPARRRR